MYDPLLFILYASDVLDEGQQFRDDALVSDIQRDVGRAIEKCYILDAVRDAIDPYLAGVEDES